MINVVIGLTDEEFEYTKKKILVSKGGDDKKKEYSG